MSGKGWSAIGGGLLLLAALVLLLLPEDEAPTPWSTLHDQPSASEEDRGPAEASGLRESGAQGAGDAGERQAVLSTAKFTVMGRLTFPDGVAVPDRARVLAIPHGSSGWIPPEKVRSVLEAGTPITYAVDADGRFELPLPGEDPLAESWKIIASAPGWLGVVSFPDPRPNAPTPEMEFDLEMSAIFGATVEVKMADGSAPPVARETARESGGPGMYSFGGWSTTGPARENSPTAMLALPSGLPPLCGGQDPSIGFGRKELAVQVGGPDRWKAGKFDHNYTVRLPGYQPIQQVVEMRPLALGEIPHYEVILEPLGAQGTLALRFDRSTWWRTELETHAMSRLRVELKYEGELPEERSGDWAVRLDRIPDGGMWSMPGLLEGEYTVTASSLESGESLPVTPNRVAIRAQQESTARIDCGDFGVLLLERPEGEEPEWSTGRLEFMYVDDDGMRREVRRGWPVRLGPYPAGEGVILIRSLDRKTPPQSADRLNHSDEFLVVEGTTTRYTIVGVR